MMLTWIDNESTVFICSETEFVLFSVFCLLENQMTWYYFFYPSCAPSILKESTISPIHKTKRIIHGSGTFLQHISILDEIKPQKEESKAYSCKFKASRNVKQQLKMILLHFIIKTAAVASTSAAIVTFLRLKL